MSDKLKLCPFCGEIPVERDNFSNCELFITSCENPKYRIHPYIVGMTREECTCGWNRRYEPEECRIEN